MKEQYDGVITRFLRHDECLIPSKENQLPFVIEANSPESSSIDFLQSFLSTHSSDILNNIASYGAVLLRGFNVNTTGEFEKTILSIRGMQGMSHLFMSEPGRDRVDGLDYVFHTNSRVKTGGSYHLGGFHNENYYSPDVPGIISFCCFDPAKLGGETGLINMASVYEKLDTSLKEKLEEKTFFVSKWPLTTIANRYQIKPEVVKKTCIDFGLSVDENNFVSMYKPSVLKHPVTGKKIIQANLSAEIPALNDAILNQFFHDYKGWKWMVHKAAWKYIGYHRLRKLSFMLPVLFHHPIRFLKMRKQVMQRIKQYTNNTYPRINSVFKADDIKTLAFHMRDSYASFSWQKGDVLIIDNLQVAHAGMPGKVSKKYPRKIRAMLCNPLKISYSNLDLGLQNKDGMLHATLGETMHKTSMENNS
ncbi:MAG: TauD/TfdA family dioxygenase [Gammaproteobacteria bacterium]|nr:TauD/TfdA family dioxygenase [Gammaproteobacteria bacterium]